MTRLEFIGWVSLCAALLLTGALMEQTEAAVWYCSPTGDPGCPSVECESASGTCPNNPSTSYTARRKSGLMWVPCDQTNNGTQCPAPLFTRNTCLIEYYTYTAVGGDCGQLECYEVTIHPGC